MKAPLPRHPKKEPVIARRTPKSSSSPQSSQRTAKSIATSSSGVAQFVSKARALKRIANAQTRIIFSLDATASRAPTWQEAQSLHQELFDAASESTGLALQLCYFKGLATFHSSHWVTTADGLRKELSEVNCEGGVTQLQRLLHHCLDQYPDSSSLKAIIFIGDAVEENSGVLNDLAIKCRMAKRPLFIFQEGSDTTASAAFSSMAALSGGVHIPLGDSSADQLRELLASVIRLATGGRKALESSRRESDKLLLAELKRS